MRSLVINAIAYGSWQAIAYRYDGLTHTVAVVCAAVSGFCALASAVHVGMNRWSKEERDRANL